jgi:trimeric autotransporter adhesin
VVAVRAQTSVLVAGGAFTTASAVAAPHVAQWDGTAWSTLGGGMDNDVYALAVFQGDLVAGGTFTLAGDVAASRVARWNGTVWAALGTGVDGIVYALAESNGDLVAGGSFTTAGGVGVGRIARWNGTIWLGLGSGLDGTVLALVTVGGGVAAQLLVAGGQFANAGGVLVNGIAQWDGIAWSALGSGVTGSPSFNAVFALALAPGDGTSVVAGGTFLQAGGVAANNVATWTPGPPAAWSALGGGVSNAVYAAAAADGARLVVGGDFTTAGASTASRVAQWDGTVWSPLGAGMDTSVYALTLFQGRVVAGGPFARADGTVVNYMAQWNGTAWTALTGTLGVPGMNNYVQALAVYTPPARPVPPPADEGGSTSVTVALAVVLSVAAVVAIVFGLFWLRRRRLQAQVGTGETPSETTRLTDDQPATATATDANKRSDAGA